MKTINEAAFAALTAKTAKCELPQTRTLSITNFYDVYNTPTEDYGGILGILQAAAPDRVRMGDLADALGITTRQVRKEVELLRRRGIPVCSSQSGIDGGYWLSGGDGELQAYAARAKKTAVNRLKLVNQMRKNAAEQQPTLFDAAGGVGNE